MMREEVITVIEEMNHLLSTLLIQTIIIKINHVSYSMKAVLNKEAKDRHEILLMSKHIFLDRGIELKLTVSIAIEILTKMLIRKL